MWAYLRCYFVEPNDKKYMFLYAAGAAVGELGTKTNFF